MRHDRRESKLSFYAGTSSSELNKRPFTGVNLVER